MKDASEITLQSLEKMIVDLGVIDVPSVPLERLLNQRPTDTKIKDDLEYMRPRVQLHFRGARSCHFRDLIGEFKAVGAQPVGISADRVERQRHFAEKHSLG